MLTIRREQYQVFKPVAEEVYITSVVDFLRHEYGVRTVQLPNGSLTIGDLPDDTLRAMVVGGIERARNFELTSCSALVSFVTLMFLTAPNFDQHTLILNALLDESIEPNDRIEKLFDRTVDQNWITVKESYDPRDWTLTLPEENE